MKELIKAAASAASAASSAGSAARSNDSATAATAAHLASNSADSAAAAAYSASGYAHFATAAPYFTDSTTASYDANHPKAWHPLWQNASESEGLSDAWNALKEQWAADEAGQPFWNFFIDWYEKLRDGKMRPEDWTLTQRIALEVTEEEWEAGQGAVSKRIAKIQKSLLVSKAPLAETLEIDPETGLFRTVPLPLQNAPLLTALVSRVQDALDDAVAGDNGLNERSKEVLVLTRTFTRYANDPQRVEMDFTDVAVGLRRQIEQTFDLPASAANIGLLAAAEEAVRGIRATYPDVAENRRILAAQVLNALTDEDKLLLEKAQPLLAEMSDPALAEDFNEDIPALINDNLLPLPTGAPGLPAADPATRVFNRVSKMSLILEDLKARGAEAFDSPGNKTVRLVAQYGAFSAILWEVLKIGLRAIGVI
ncbi:MAG: hypothetical protein AB8B58_04430 [Roseobacter sp.]